MCRCPFLFNQIGVEMMQKGVGFFETMHNWDCLKTDQKQKGEKSVGKGKMKLSHTPDLTGQQTL